MATDKQAPEFVVVPEKGQQVSQGGSDTEDEEIKFNCHRVEPKCSPPLPESYGSDLSESCVSDEEESDQDDDRSQGVVAFTCDHVQLQSPKLLHPKPSTPQSVRSVVPLDTSIDDNSKLPNEMAMGSGPSLPFLVDGNIEESRSLSIGYRAENSDDGIGCHRPSSSEPKRKRGWCPACSAKDDSEKVVSIKRPRVYLTIGQPAQTESAFMRHNGEGPRECSPILTSSDEEDLDQQLGWELGAACEDDMSFSNRSQSPVPLLTPPGSPLTVEVDGRKTTVCEWPSNLAIDSALAAVCELRPLSPASFEELSRD